MQVSRFSYTTEKKQPFLNPVFTAKKLPVGTTDGIKAFAKIVAASSLTASISTLKQDTFEKELQTENENSEFSNRQNSVTGTLRGSFKENLFSEHDWANIQQHLNEDNIDFAETLANKIYDIMNFYVGYDEDYNTEKAIELLDTVKTPEQSKIGKSLLENNFLIKYSDNFKPRLDLRGLTLILQNINCENFNAAKIISTDNSFHDKIQFNWVLKYLDKKTLEYFYNTQLTSIESFFKDFNHTKDLQKKIFNNIDLLPIINTMVNKTNLDSDQIKKILSLLNSNNQIYAHYKISTCPDLNPEEFKYTLNQIEHLGSQWRLKELDDIETEIINYLSNTDAPNPRFSADDYFILLNLFKHCSLYCNESPRTALAPYKKLLNSDTNPINNLLKLWAKENNLVKMPEGTYYDSIYREWITSDVHNDTVEKVYKIIDSPNQTIKPSDIVQFLQDVNPLNYEIAYKLYSEHPKGITPTEIQNVLSKISSATPLEIVSDVCTDTEFPISYIGVFLIEIKKYTLEKETLMKAYQDAKSALKNVQNYPQLYKTGTDDNSILQYFHGDFVGKLVNFAAVFQSKKDLDNLLRRRLTKAYDVLYNFGQVSTIRLRKLINCKKPDGTKFSSTERIELIKFLKSYEEYSAFDGEFSFAINSGVIDIDKYKRKMFCDMLEEFGFTQSELKNIPQEKILSWDIDYAYKISENFHSYDNKDMLIDIIESCLFNDFSSYIHNPENKYGNLNVNVQKIFENKNLKYEKFRYPNKKLEVLYSQEDYTSVQFNSIKGCLCGCIEFLRDTPAKNYVEKVLNNYFEKDVFQIPQSAKTNPQQFCKFTTDVMLRLTRVWTQAKNNSVSQNDTVKARATQTLKIKNDLETILNKARELPAVNDKNLKLKIRTWDRIPQKDLFQGEYSDCCIKADGVNRDAILDYLVNTSFNMMEIVDTDTNKVIGNALYFFAIEKNTPVLVVDNIEILSSYRTTPHREKSLLYTITQYARRIAKSVTGKDTSIYLGSRNNDIFTDDLIKTHKDIAFLGEFLEDGAHYLDAYGGWKHKFGCNSANVYTLYSND